MKASTPVGQPIYAPLCIRLVIGSYFLLAGLAKLDDHRGFIEEVHRIAILPELLGTLYGIVLPYLEIFFGALFIIGLWSVLSSVILSILLLSFILAFGVFSTAGPFNKDILLLGAAASIMFSGGGAFSIDRFRTSG